MEQEIIREISGDASTAGLIAKNEINQQIATARAYPRSMRRFMDEAQTLVTLTQDVADECIYALPRDGKTVEGPSARFAEIIVHAWGNARAGSRVVDDSGDFIVAQGVFHDLEKNVAITYEVQRRIVDRNGKRFKPDMIGVTANAACSIALRNAVLKGVPKALWSPIFEAAKKVIQGTAETLHSKRSKALDALQKVGATEAMVLAKLELKGREDINVDHILLLRGIYTAIRDGDTTVEQAFDIEDEKKTVLKDQIKRKQKDEPDPAGERGNSDGGDLVSMLDALAKCNDPQKVDVLCSEAQERLSQSGVAAFMKAASKRITELEGE